jgi:integrase/recombinase XerD
MPRRAQWDGNGESPSPKMIDLRLPGFGRLQIASGLTHRVPYEARVAMIKEFWALGGIWSDAVRALAALRFDVNALYAAKLEGREAIERLLATQGGEPLAELIEAYLAQTDAQDVAKMRQRLERYADSLGRRPLTTDVTTASIEVFLSKLVDGRTADTDAPAPAKGSTINRYRAVIGGMCTWAVSVGRMPAHPIAGKKVKKRAEPMHQLPELSADEYRDYIGAVRRESPDLAVVLLTLVHTGADVGEVFSRVTRDVDLERRRIRFHRTKTQRYETANRPRFVPMPQLVVDELRAHIAAHRLRGNQSLFGMIDRHEVELAHRRAVRSIERSDLTLKSLRHIAAISWVKAGNHIRLVQRWLGHASLSQTMKYTDYEPDADEIAPLVERAAGTLTQTMDVVPIAIATHIPMPGPVHAPSLPLHLRIMSG